MGDVGFDTREKSPILVVSLRLITVTMVLYMSFDRFLLTVESRDLSQADKSIIRVSSFPKLFYFSILLPNLNYRHV